MSQLDSPFFRLMLRCSPEALAAYGMSFFGVHTLTAWILSVRYNATSAFATIYPTGPGHFQIVYLVAAPLLIGGALILHGLRLECRWAITAGGLLGSGVMISALASCCLGNSLGTGVPAYANLLLFYIPFALFRSLRIRWVPVAE